MSERPQRKRISKPPARSARPIRPGSTPTVTILGAECIGPSDEVAARVVRGGPDHGPSVRRADRNEFGKNPPPNAHRAPPKGVEDLRGLKRDRLTVIGYLGAANKNKGTAWLVRCVCGMYERRRAHTLKASQAKGSPDSCGPCRHMDTLRRDAWRIDTGELRPFLFGEWPPRPVTRLTDGSYLDPVVHECERTPTNSPQS